MRRIHLEYRYLARGNSAEEELRFVIHRSRLCHRAQKLRWELAARGVSQRRVDRAMKLARASAGRDYGTGADDSGNEQWPR